MSDADAGDEDTLNAEQLDTVTGGAAAGEPSEVQSDQDDTDSQYDAGSGLLSGRRAHTPIKI